MNGPDWTLLRSFLAVAETGSLSAAAARLGATQPTLGRHVRELEAVLSVRLFNRTARGLEPTEAALALVEDARAMAAAAEQLARKAEGRVAQPHGTVRITASVVVANLVLPPIVAALRAAEPGVQIELVASDATGDLLLRDADIALRMFDPTQQALRVRRLGETPLGLFGARALLERTGRPRTVREALALGLIGFDRSEAMLRAMAKLGHPVTREDFPVRCDDQLVYWNMLLAGAGLGIAQMRLARDRPELEQVELGLPLPVLPVWLVMHEEVQTSVRIRLVADALGTAVREWLGG